MTKSSQCPHCDELARLTKAYEGAERKAADHEGDLIRLRTEQASLHADLHEYIAQLQGERDAAQADGATCLAAYNELRIERGVLAQKLQLAYASMRHIRDRASRYWQMSGEGSDLDAMNACDRALDMYDENAALLASRARFMLALKLVMARHAALLRQRIVLGAVRDTKQKKV